MLMEIYLSEEKAKKNNINLEECYQKIDNYFLKHGVKINHQSLSGCKKRFWYFCNCPMAVTRYKMVFKDC